MTSHHETHQDGDAHRRRKEPSRWLVRALMIVLIAVGGYYIMAEHGTHLLAAWSLLILLACPLMHLLHGGHGGHGRHQPRSDADDRNG